MPDPNHPSYEELFLRAAREPYPTRDAVERHLRAGCPDCVRRERIVDRVLQAVETGPLPSPPRAWRDRAVALAPASRGGGTGLLEATQRTLGRVTEMLARLVPSGGPGAAPALALRGPGAADRHLLFRAGPFEVDLALFDSGALVGQVLAEGDRARELDGGVCVLIGAEGAREAPLEGPGDFHFGSVNPGSYDLLVESPRLRLFMPGLDLRDSEGAS